MSTTMATRRPPTRKVTTRARRVRDRAFLSEGLRRGHEELERLASEGEISDILDRVSMQEIANSWIAHHEGEPGPDGDNARTWWAAELLMSSEWYDDDPTRSQAVLIALCDAATEELQFANIGAGPIENYLAGADKDRLEWLVRQGHSNPNLRRALRHAWLWNQVSPPDFERLKQAAGGELAGPVE